MEQKIVIKLAMNSEKCRSKAFKIAAAAQGVHSVSLEGAESDHMVVTGDGVDPVCLANKLRKKLHHANILSVEEVKDEEDDGAEDTEDDGEREETRPIHCDCYGHYPPFPCYIIYDQDRSDCIIM